MQSENSKIVIFLDPFSKKFIIFASFFDFYQSLRRLPC